MADVTVVTDSTCYLPRALTDSHDITLVSHYYELGDGPLRELDFDGDFDRFFAAVDAAEGVARTSPTSVEDFVSVFEQLLDRHGAVVAVLLSSGVSKTCEHARQAMKRLQAKGIDRTDEERVVVVDSATSGGLLGLQAVAAAEAAAAGLDVSGVVEAARRLRQQSRMWILLDTLEYLRRSGRASSAAAWVGSVLDIKPVITIESEFKAVERVRTRRRGVERLVELMREQRAVGADRWFMHHTGADEDTQRLVDRLTRLFGKKPEFVSVLGPTSATNLGPRTLAVGGFPESALDSGHG